MCALTNATAVKRLFFFVSLLFFVSMPLLVVIKRGSLVVINLYAVAMCACSVRDVCMHTATHVRKGAAVISCPEHAAM